MLEEMPHAFLASAWPLHRQALFDALELCSETGIT